MKKTMALLLAAALLALCGCGAQSTATPAAPVQAPAATQAPTEAPAATPEEETTGEITVTDGIGREVRVTPGEYQRVVCIGAGALRMYCYVGDVSLLCGVEDIDNETLAERPKMFDAVARPYVLRYSEVFGALPSCGVGGPNAQTAEAEKILSCEPDIVISEYEDTEKADALQEQLGVPVITLRTGPAGVFGQEFLDSMTLLGQVFGKEGRADELCSYVQGQIREIQARTNSPYQVSPKVYICGLGNWGTTNHLMTAQNYAPFTIGNVDNVVKDLAKDGIQPMEAEKFVALGEDMDIMVIDAAAVKNIKPLYAEDPSMFDSCKAWREGEVYLEMAYNAYYTNYEIALINAWYIASLAHPEAFPDLDITEKTNEVTSFFLGAPLAEEIFACPQSFGGFQKIDTAAFFVS